MKKADYKFHRDRKEKIQNDSRKNGTDSSWIYNDNNPIFIPKRKKKK